MHKNLDIGDMLIQQSKTPKVSRPMELKMCSLSLKITLDSGYLIDNIEIPIKNPHLEGQTYRNFYFDC